MAASIIFRHNSLIMINAIRKSQNYRSFMKFCCYPLTQSSDVHSPSNWRPRPAFVVGVIAEKLLFSTDANTSCSRRCRRCERQVEKEHLKCDSCGAVQPPHKNANYFKVFGIQHHTFTIDQNELTRRFRALQSEFHPDKFAGELQSDQDLSTECSSFINTAYQTLLHPVQRGQYLLKLNKQELTESSVEMSAEFLMEIMEKNEELAGDISQKGLQSMDIENKVIIKSIFDELCNAFEHHRIETAKMLLAKLKYYINIDEKIKTMKIKDDISN